MTTNDLLACVTAGAQEYIQTTINTENQSDYQKLKKLFDKNKFEAKSFNDTELDILTFDWQTLNRDRNWWWQLQALPFLNWYSNSFSLQSEEERYDYYSLCMDAVVNWINRAKENKASPLVWHDHATAFRVRNIANWVIFCDSYHLILNEDSRAEILGRLIIEHLDWLQDDSHYSKHTNHGFDQSMIALTVASMFDFGSFETFRQRNRDRLEDEVTFAFTDEGVHKENSPGYQKMMLARLKQLRSLALLHESVIAQIGEKYIEKAETFLRAITLPNGLLPMIGDTRGGDKGLQYTQGKKVDFLDYSDSGYVIIRGFDGSDKEFFLLMKNTHLSNYHRHDDDLMIFLYYDGEVVFGDGGLLSHQENCKKRKFVRSHLAHSAPYLNCTAIRDRKKLKVVPKIQVLTDSHIVMESGMFGNVIERKVEIDVKENIFIRISDNLISPDNEKIKLKGNLFFERVKPTFLNGNELKISFPTFLVNLKLKSQPELEYVVGWDSCRDRNAITSFKYGEYQHCMAFTYSAKTIEIGCSSLHSIQM